MTWRSTRLKFLAESAIRNGLGESGEYEDPSWPRYVRTTDIAGPRSLRDDVFKSLPPEVARRAMLCRGDLLMTAAGATIGKSYLHLDDAPACYAGYLARFRARQDVEPRFVAYWMQSQPYWDQIAVGAVRSTIDNFSAGKYRNMLLQIPPFDEQRAIANFLDAQTLKLDRLLDLRGRQATLLDELDKAVIRDSLTGGSENNPSTSRAKRVPWLASHPAHWAAVPLRYLARIQRGASPRPIENPIYFDTEGSHGWVRISDVSASGKYLTETTQRLSSLGKSLSVPLEPGELIVSIAASVGKPIITGIRCCIHDGFLAIRQPDVNKEFLYYVLLLGDCFAGLGKLGTQLNLNSDTVGSIDVPVPSMAEQLSIVARVESALERTAGLRRDLLRQVALLAERRSAVITTATTGQLDLTTTGPGVA